MLGCIVNLLVDAEHEGDIFILGGGGNNNLFYWSAEMLVGVVGVGETACGFEHDLGADGLPRELGRVFFGKNLEALAVDGNTVRSRRYLVVQVAENGVVLQQVGERFRISEIVDGYEFDIWVFERGAQHVATDAPEAVNAYFDSHLASVMTMKIRLK